MLVTYLLVMKQSYTCSSLDFIQILWYLIAYNEMSMSKKKCICTTQAADWHLEWKGIDFQQKTLNGVLKHHIFRVQYSTAQLVQNKTPMKLPFLPEIT